MNNKIFEEILRNVEKPGRYLGGEWNSVKKDPQSVRVKVALAFPDLYEIGMSYLGQKILYSILTRQPHILAERVFSPWGDMEHELREKKEPLFSLENRLPLFEFDIIGFSLLYELNYSNILTILDLGGVPFRSEDRGIDDPLVIAGGPAAFNPEPVADIFDLFLIGDGEEAFVELIQSYESAKKETRSKEAVLRELEKIKGVYIPKFYTPSLEVEKRVFNPYREAPFPEDIIVPNIRVVFNRVSVEAARGCPQSCRFCQASSLYFPHRVKAPGSVVSTVFNSLESTGYEDASLAALSVGDYPYLEDTVRCLMDGLEEQKVSLSLPSLRPSSLTREVMDQILKVRKTGFTLVPEAGTERLRSVINKDMKDAEIFEAARNAFSNGWRLLKLYFMMGLPTEEDRDIEGIIRMVTRIIDIGYEVHNKPPMINLSVSSFIPKPHTPFQWFGMTPEEELRKKRKYLRTGLKNYPSVKVKVHDIKSSVLEAVFSRGDRRLFPVLMKAWELGARFDSWTDCFHFSLWVKAFDFNGIDYRDYLTDLDQTAPLPWSHIQTGIKPEHFLSELEKARSGIPSKNCWKRDCKECRGCTLSALVERKYEGSLKSEKWNIQKLGQKTGEEHRYLVTFSKRSDARFFSHVDLINIIHRSFRRAGIPALYSKGFHPKMKMSFLPALPLGMGGREELLEFRSEYLIEEAEFLDRLKRNVPEGMVFTGMKEIPLDHPSLIRSVSGFVYSLDLEHPGVENAFQFFLERENLTSSAGPGKINRALNTAFKHFSEHNLKKVHFDPESHKIFLTVESNPQNVLRPQELVEKIFKINRAVYFMTREEIIKS